MSCFFALLCFCSFVVIRLFLLANPTSPLLGNDSRIRRGPAIKIGQAWRPKFYNLVLLLSAVV